MSGKTVLLSALFVLVSNVAYAEMILVPVTLRDPVPGAFGSVWTTTLTVHNASDEGVVIKPVSVSCGVLCPAHVAVLPHHTLRILPNATSPALIEVPSDRSSDVSFVLRIQDLSRQAESFGTTVPVVREADFRTGKLSLIDVPLMTGFRHTLRIYDPDARQGSAVRVRLLAFSPQSVPTTLPQAPDRVLGETIVPIVAPTALGSSTAGYVELSDLSAIANLGSESHVSVEIESVVPALRFWAFVSVTNNNTQQATVIAPE